MALRDERSSPQTPGRIARLGVAVRTSPVLVKKRSRDRSGPLPKAVRTRDLPSPLVSPYVPHLMARFAKNSAELSGDLPQGKPSHSCRYTYSSRGDRKTPHGCHRSGRNRGPSMRRELIEPRCAIPNLYSPLQHTSKPGLGSRPRRPREAPKAAQPSKYIKMWPASENTAFYAVR